MSLSSCSGIFFYPQSTLRLVPKDIGLEYQDVSLSSSDGTKLHGWFLPAKGEAWTTLLFLHGNAENISTHIGSVYWLPKNGVNVFLLDYRGYGASQGTPTVAGAQEDIETALAYLCKERTAPGDNIAVFAQSIGGALGISQLARSAYRGRINAFVVDSAFSSYPGIVREKLSEFWLTWPLQYPLSWLIPNFDSPINSVGQINPIPLLIIHGTGDAIVSFRHSERLYLAAKQPKELWLIPQAGHIAALADEDLQGRFIEFLRRHSSTNMK